MRTLSLLLLLVSSHAFTSPSTAIRIASNRPIGILGRDITGPASIQSAIHSKLFAYSVPIGNANKRICGSMLRDKRRLISAMALLLLIPRRALAATMRQTVVARTKKFIRPALLALVTVVTLSATGSTIRSRKRQALDATSEWGRYASNPAARGRAVMVIFLRLLPYWARQQFVNAKRKSELKAKGGAIFADSLLLLGPLYIKLGQILSCRDNLLPPEWITAMERLQDKVPAKSGQEALDLAYSALGSEERFHRIFSDFDTVPLAAASLGQVHRCTLRETNETVAVKLQRPRLREIYDQDLALLSKIAKTVDNFGKRGQVGGVSQSWTQIFDDAKNILYREIDYRDEADNCVRFNADFGLGKGGKEVRCAARSLDGKFLPSAAKWLRAPYVYQDISSERALIMEFVPSIKITSTPKLDAANVTQEGKEYLADSLARAYLRSFCVNRFFSTDPHPGNLGVDFLASGKPRLVMYDFGQACELQADQAEGILDVIEAIVDMDSDRCVDAFEKMGVLKEDADLQKVRAKVQNNFETGKVTVKRKKLKKSGYKFKKKAAISPTNSTLATEKTEKAKDTEVMGFFTLPAEYAFVARALSQMDGVGKSLDPEFDFISSSAQYIVEIKGAGNYLKDEFLKWVLAVQKRELALQKALQ